MYARFYVKFHEKTGYPGHLVILCADKGPEAVAEGDRGDDAGWGHNVPDEHRGEGGRGAGIGTARGLAVLLLLAPVSEMGDGVFPEEGAD